MVSNYFKVYKLNFSGLKYLNIRLYNIKYEFIYKVWFLNKSIIKLKTKFTEMF